ncbi:RidA family protein [Mycobacterium sp. 21AC1]|uniref:RidA family protein n=1 Tax=[Mycobacterium] appelbergii TaxID=2939269 RepID=UPI0029393602|nr:RidA family protein [Mycobacterium sp. 21AC1]MDV3129033.1 RidA family protein [Mycobacterium sp. 21AC1]
MIRPSGHYALGIRRGQWLFVAGQTGEDAMGRLGDLAEQTAQAIANITEILAAHGAGIADVVRMTCFLADIDEFSTFDAAYSRALGGPGGQTPVRTTVGANGLPAGELVEIEATAYLGETT